MRARSASFGMEPVGRPTPTRKQVGVEAAIAREGGAELPGEATHLPEGGRAGEAGEGERAKRSIVSGWERCRFGTSGGCAACTLRLACGSFKVEPRRATYPRANAWGSKQRSVAKRARGARSLQGEGDQPPQRGRSRRIFRRGRGLGTEPGRATNPHADTWGSKQRSVEKRARGARSLQGEGDQPPGGGRACAAGEGGRATKSERAQRAS